MTKNLSIMLDQKICKFEKHQEIPANQYINKNKWQQKNEIKIMAFEIYF